MPPYAQGVVRIPKAFRDMQASLESALGEPVSVSGLTGTLGIFQAGTLPVPA